MICPRCGGQNVSIMPVTELKNKTRWCCGCLFTPLAFLLPKRKTKTHTEAVCQHCGNRWRVTGSMVRHNVAMPQTNGYAPQYAPIAPPASMNAVPQPSINAPVSSPAYDYQQSTAPQKPFYKETWFMILCGWWFWLVEIAIWLFAKPVHIAYMFIKSKIEVEAEPFDITTAGDSETVKKLQAFSIYPTQFYKTKWFFILLCVFFPYIAILILLLKKQNWKLRVRVVIVTALTLWWIFWSMVMGGINNPSSADVSSSDLIHPSSSTDVSNSDATNV